MPLAENPGLAFTSGMPDRANVLIAGGGIIGSSLAWALASRGVDDVVVVDLDLNGIYASSELNAGGARATWWQPVNIESCKATLEFFREHAELFGFQPRGYLWLYDDADFYARALDKRKLQNNYGLEVEALQSGEVAERFPVLDRSMHEIVGATFSPFDGLLNPNAVRRWYREQAEKLGVVFCNRHYIAGVTTLRSFDANDVRRRVSGVEIVRVKKESFERDELNLREILTSHSIRADLHDEELNISCDTLVNCLGAWSPIFAAKIGIHDVSEPVRRQISLIDVHKEDLRPGLDLESMGMIVDSSGLYFHPEGSYILAGYSIPREAPGFDFEYEGDEFFEREIWGRLAHRSSSFERCAHVRGWAGLYAVTPDCSGIASAVAGFSNLFEAHSFTGRGVMQSYSVGQEMAALIDTGRFEHVDLSALSRDRFADPARLIPEDLHI